MRKLAVADEGHNRRTEMSVVRVFDVVSDGSYNGDMFQRIFAFLFVSGSVIAAPIFDLGAIRDTRTLEVEVLQDWKVYPKDNYIRQKLIEITVCEWWSGQKVRLPVTLNALANGKVCRNVVVANQPLANRAVAPTRGQLALLKEHGVGVVLIGMGTIDAMEPKGKLHVGMREQMLKTKDPRYTAGWIWGMSQMRALTAAMTEPEVFQPGKVLTTGGSKRGVASALAGIHDDRFTAIMPVVAPPLGDPGSPVHVLGSGPNHLKEIDDQFYADLAAGKLGLPETAAKALKDREGRRSAVRLTVEQARAAGWTDADIARVNATLWNAGRITDYLPALQKKGLEIFYNVGCNDSVTPALRQLGERIPDFPICIIPGGQHGGPKDVGYTRRVPMMPEVQGNFLSFARHHFFGHRDLIQPPIIVGQWDDSTRTLKVSVTFPDGTIPQKNELWWNVDRSEPYTLPFEFDKWDSANLKPDGKGQFTTSVQLESEPQRVDFLSLHTHIENRLPLTISSPYQRIEPANPAGYSYRRPSIPHGSRLVFIGDSITDMKWGRNEKDRNHYLGHSFVYLIASRLGVDMPGARLEFFNRGKSGNRVTDLKARWQKDAVDMKPDVLTILIGVNDVSRGKGQPVALKQWEADYRDLLTRSRKANPELRIVLLDPFVLRSGRLQSDEVWRFWRGEIDKQRAVVTRLAKEFDAVHIRTQDVFDRAAKEVSPEHWIWDGVHPLPQGHELIARSWIEQVSARW